MLCVMNRKSEYVLCVMWWFVDGVIGKVELCGVFMLCVVYLRWLV